MILSEKGATDHEAVFENLDLWLTLLGLLGAVLSITGIDDIRLFILFNPILHWLGESDFRDFLSATPYLLELLHVITMAGYGILLDIIRAARK